MTPSRAVPDIVELLSDATSKKSNALYSRFHCLSDHHSEVKSWPTSSDLGDDSKTRTVTSSGTETQCFAIFTRVPIVQSVRHQQFGT